MVTRASPPLFVPMALLYQQAEEEMVERDLASVEITACWGNVLEEEGVEI